MGRTSNSASQRAAYHSCRFPPALRKKALHYNWQRVSHVLQGKSVNVVIVDHLSRILDGEELTVGARRFSARIRQVPHDRESSHLVDGR
jgi:hypothetical protein